MLKCVSCIMLVQPHFDGEAKKGLSASSVWTEIQSTLKGSVQAVRNKLEGKPWLLQEYVDLAKV